MPSTRRIVLKTSSLLGKEEGGLDLDKKIFCEGNGGGVCLIGPLVFLGL